MSNGSSLRGVMVAIGLIVSAYFGAATASKAQSPNADYLMRVATLQSSTALGSSSTTVPNSPDHASARRWTAIRNNMPVPNGCGSYESFFSPHRVPQSVAGVDFRPVCNTHDRCYSTPWSLKSVCDDRFGIELHRACGALPSGRDRDRCDRMANWYHTAVVVGGSGAFQQAQQQAIFVSRSGPSLFGLQDFTERFNLLPNPKSLPKHRLVEGDYRLID